MIWFLALLLVAFLLAGPILALAALVRVRRFPDPGRSSDRIDAFDARLAALARRITALEQAAAHAARERMAGPQEAGAHSSAASAAPQAQVGLGAGPMPPAPHRPEPPQPSHPLGQHPPITAPPAAGHPARPAPSAMPPMASRPAAPPGKPPASPTPPVGTRPPGPPSPPIDWERWIGIRGAAVVGAIALGLAGILFFKYSVEKGLITPAMRVVFGTLTGLGCLVGAEWLRARKYRQTAEGISGAGVVILYAAFWASHALYHLVGMPLVFGLMVLVTTVCCLLAVRHDSLLVAVLGLVGGFATPLLLSSGQDRPIGLFGYVLLLDLGLLAVGHRRRWPSLGILSLLATVLLQGLWIVLRMGPDRLFLGLVIVGVFALLFLLAGRWSGATSSGAVVLSQIGAVSFPFAFALYFASRADLGPHLYPIAILLALLSAAACWVARKQQQLSLAIGAAGAVLVVTAVWLLRHSLTTALAWETAGIAVGLAAVFHLFVEIDREDAGEEGPAPAAILAGLGFLAILVVASGGRALRIDPWLAGWTGLVCLLYRHAAFPKRAWLQIAAAAGAGLGLGLYMTHFGESVFPAKELFVALSVGACVLLQLTAQLRRDREVRHSAQHAAATLAVLVLFILATSPCLLVLGPWMGLGGTLLLGILAMIAATWVGNGGWTAAAMAATFLAHAAWTAGHVVTSAGHEDPASLFLQALAVLVFALWPLVTSRQFSESRFAWYAAALAGPLWFFPLRRLHVALFGDAAIGILPVALGSLSLLAATQSRRLGPAEDPTRRRALVWFSAVALCFVAAAIPLQLEKQWITIGWALQGVAVLALWRRLDHPGLKYFGLVLLGATTLRLVANPALLGYYPRSAVRVFNWLTYTYLVPAAALLAGVALLKPWEMARARRWEKEFYAAGHPVGAIASGFAAIVVIFVWINLTIADWFASGTTLSLRFGESPAQRLTVSIAWGVYGLILLGWGMGRDSVGLRWLSLCFLLVTIGKVFLFDLGDLRDLYRVASLVGLAVSLILVSLLYQRFVFRKAPPQAGGGIA